MLDNDTGDNRPTGSSGDGHSGDFPRDDRRSRSRDIEAGSGDRDSRRELQRESDDLFGRRAGDRSRIDAPAAQPPRPPSLLRSILGGLTLAVMGGIIGILATMLYFETRDDDEVAATATPTTSVNAAPIAVGAGEGPILAGYATRQDGLDHWESTVQLQERIGRDLEVIRVFERWDNVFPREFHTNFRDRNQTMILSVRARTTDGDEIRWRDIADAQPGDPLHSDLVGWVDRVSSFGAPVLFTFHHEADAINDNPENGSADDFIAAWRRIVDEFRSQDATNVEFVWNLTGGAFSASGDRAAEVWYPGDEYVDRISADTYNWFGCRNGFEGGTWLSLEQLTAPVLEFAQAHPTKPLMLSEFGSAEDPDDPNRKAQWFDDARELFKRPEYGRFEIISYFNSHHGAGSECAWFVDSSPQSLAAFQRFAADPFYR